MSDTGNHLGSGRDNTSDDARDESATYTFEDLKQLLVYLRDPKYGCPWDVAQTPESIVPFTIEEVYEVIEAIELNDWEGLGEELGDLLLQVVFYAQMAAEAGHFDLHEVVDRLVKKMVRRHPHVFPDGYLAPPSARLATDTPVTSVKQTWESIKQQERREKQPETAQTALEPAPLQASLAGVPKGLDALSGAQKIQTKAARFGLDWRAGSSAGEIDAGVVAAVRAEIEELCQAVTRQSQNNTDIAAELGDVLFSCVNLARHLKLDAAQCLRQSTRKFKHRAEIVEKLFLADQPDGKMASASEETLDRLWQRAKKQE